MKIERIELHHIAMPLVHPFETSFGRQTTRASLLVAIYAEGLAGWGECTASSEPWYSYETVETAWHILRDFLIPLVRRTIDSSKKPGASVLQEAVAALQHSGVRGHPMAHAAIENALWDLRAQAEGMSLAGLLGGQRVRVPVGVSIGIEPTVAALLEQVKLYVDQGYGRVKLKVKPGWDVEVVRAVRKRWPALALQVDANAAYTLADIHLFQELDKYDLLLIEQPFHQDDIVDHSKLQAQLRTPICLDESIQSLEHTRWALDLDACRIINIKVGRVGGLTVARQIHDYCAQKSIPVWCGGMLETNIGRATNVALASLPNFTLPGDISASTRYYQNDIAGPDFALNHDSTLSVPTGVGLGVHVIDEWVADVRLRHQVFS